MKCVGTHTQTQYNTRMLLLYFGQGDASTQQSIQQDKHISIPPRANTRVFFNVLKELRNNVVEHLSFSLFYTTHKMHKEEEDPKR